MSPLPPQLLEIPESEAEQVRELQRVLHLGAAKLTSPDGSHELHLSDALYKLLLRIIADVAEGRPLSYVSENQDLTTQQAAEYLGMSRQFFVGLLEKNIIHFHRVGKHRRVTVRDVMAYRKQRDHGRHEGINALAKEANANGTYDDF